MVQTLPIAGVSQAKAARIAGFLWVLTMATSIVGTEGAFGKLIVRGDVAATAQNIIEGESLFRIGVASMVFTSVAVLVLIWAFYVLLEPVNRSLALLGVFFRLIESALTFVAPVIQLVALKYLGQAEYLKAFEPDQLYALMNISMSTYGTMLYTGFICLGLGSTVFAWLFLKSGYVPKAFAYLGIVASVLLSVGSFIVILRPELNSFFYPYGMVPMFFYEVGLGFWLWIKGAKV